MTSHARLLTIFIVSFLIAMICFNWLPLMFASTTIFGTPYLTLTAGTWLVVSGWMMSEFQNWYFKGV